jgi:hypothetical protein
MAVKIWDIEKRFYWHNDDGEDLVFKDTIAARNMMYTEGYTYEYMDSAVEFHRHDPIVDDKSGYDLQ